MQIFLQLFCKKVIDSPKTAKLKGLDSQKFKNHASKMAEPMRSIVLPLARARG